MDRKAKNMTLYILYDLSPFSLPFDFSESLRTLAAKYGVPYRTLVNNLHNHSRNNLGFTVEKVVLSDDVNDDARPLFPFRSL